jgi:hypothetical protein
VARTEEAQRTAIEDAPPALAAADAPHPVGNLSSRARLGAALLGIALAILAASVCAVVGVLLAQAFFGTAGGIL